MKKIHLKKLSLKNFKGIKSFEIDFDNDLTEIYGDNGTGKTTLFDAFTWLLFGKDHNDNAKFEIKTLNSANKAIPKLEHEVEAVLLVDDVLCTIKRVYREKWVKQRGSIDSVLTGHETAYFYNNAPVTLTEFSDKINMIIDERLFKLVTNPFYFNGLSWQDRRTILTNSVDIVSDEEIAKENHDFVKLLHELSGKSLEEFRREINATKKKVKVELDEIPTRIDELYNSLPNVEDFESIKKEIDNKRKEEEKLVAQIIDSSKVDEAHSNIVSAKQKEVSDFAYLKNKLEEDARKLYSFNNNEYQKQVDEQNRSIQLSEFELQKLERKIEHDISERRKYESQISHLRKDFEVKQSEQLVMNEHEFSCPTCKREFEPYQIAEMQNQMQSNFNLKKAKDLEDINTTGKELKGLLEKISKNVKESEEEKLLVISKIETLKEGLASLKSTSILTIEDLLANENYTTCLINLDNAKKEVEVLRDKVIDKDLDTIKALEQQRETLKDEIAELNKLLYRQEQIANGKKRIENLEEQSSLLAQQLAELEQKEFIIDKFHSEKIYRIEESINSMFPTVKFKLFNEQLNGGTSECCDTLLNGVPFSNANNAGKIQAGIEIINVLSKKHNCTAPIFVDNAESIVNIPQTDAQLIKLVVSENHKCLTIN